MAQWKEGKVPQTRLHEWMNAEIKGVDVERFCPAPKKGFRVTGRRIFPPIKKGIREGSERSRHKGGRVEDFRLAETSPWEKKEYQRPGRVQY